MPKEAMRSTNGVTYGYIRLCAAIVQSGIDADDEFFLSSDWCRTLTDAVVEWHNKPNNGKDTYTYMGGGKCARH